MSTGTVEKRDVKRAASVESRADGTKVLSGYAAVFYQPGNDGTQYELWEDFFERIDPAAFNRALAERQDVICDVDHGQLLGRTSSGTLRLSVDAIGLRYECSLGDTTAAKDCAESIRRGDLSGSSFAFIARSREWVETDDGREFVIIKDLDLVDVGPVKWPAYTATTTSVRSDKASIEAEREEWRARKLSEGDAVSVRARMVALEND